MSARNIRIIGLVQGVFFRAETQALAQKLGLTGWVRNLPDGSVEIHAEGLEAALSELETWCHRGPPAAQVDDVHVESTPEQNLKSFEGMR